MCWQRDETRSRKGLNKQPGALQAYKRGLDSCAVIWALCLKVISDPYLNYLVLLRKVLA